ncbi:hypothetical protein HDE68_001894 [Pedobacter cryoconitis]|uniref:Carboxypeptidase-like protein n=1 Tax=Pedobacter cryoconitis TaxID=188932 RepID=A0A7W9DYK0_9SPHI|nr:hypothetical protein [Pedobacter cryoconitis]MBB5636006.1 hypothetical protein [Pedobacter cryoconitis]
MLRRLCLFSFIFFFYTGAKSQQLQGTVSDRATQLRLEQVEVFNQQTRKKTTTNAKGEFSIAAAANQVIIFYQPGYLPDTLFLVDLKPVKRYLSLNNKLLHTIEIKAGAFNPEAEYADVYRKARFAKLAQNKPFILSPSGLFGKEGRDARRFKRNLEREKSERKIDERFNERAVTALTPLKGAELDYFMVLYRPSLKELDKLDEEDFKFYLINAYKTFKALPEAQRISPSLREK